MKTIAINDPTHKALKKLCETHDISMGDFIQHGVNYFKQTGIDPKQAHTESPQKAIKELSKRVEQIIGVIKTQEQEKINPLLEQLMMLSRRAELMLGDAPKEATFKTVMNRVSDMTNMEGKNHADQLKKLEKHYNDVLEYNHKKYQEAQTDTIKKMDEVMERMDKMTAEQGGIREVIESKLSKKIF